MYAKETAYTDKSYHPVLFDDFTFLEKICDTCTNVLQKRDY
jgi:hypothetical protein